LREFVDGLGVEDATPRKGANGGRKPQAKAGGGAAIAAPGPEDEVGVGFEGAWLGHDEKTV
jgi:hypothetical protein